MNTIQELRTILSNRIMILDGAMGTMLQKKVFESKVLNDDESDAGFRKQEANLELLSLTNPGMVIQIHRSYLKAGADIVSTNTLNANAIMQNDFKGSKGVVFDMNKASAQIARAAIIDHYNSDPTRLRFVAGVIGPTDKVAFMAESTNIDGLNGILFNELYDAYLEQIRGLVAGGVDILLIETITDMLNAKAAIQAAKDINREIPLVLSFSIPDTHYESAANELLHGIFSLVKYASPLAAGYNCFSDMGKMIPLLKDLSSGCSCYTILYPNAGFPDEKGKYPVTAGKFSQDFLEYFERRLVNIAGGCCGTGPDHIRLLAGYAGGFIPGKAV